MMLFTKANITRISAYTVLTCAITLLDNLTYIFHHAFMSHYPHNAFGHFDPEKMHKNF